MFPVFFEYSGRALVVTAGVQFRLRELINFAYAVGVPREVRGWFLSQVLQTEPPVAHQALAAKPAWPPAWQIIALGGLLLWLYLPTLFHLVVQWWQDPNFSHGFFVPLFAGFVIWQERARLARVKLQPSWYGVAILGFGLSCSFLAKWARRFSFRAFRY